MTRGSERETLRAVQAWFIIPMLIAIAVGISRGIAKARQQSLGHDRCSFCQTKLKTLPDKRTFATTCRKCGRTQPWA